MSEDITDKLLHKTITIETEKGKLVYNFGFLNIWQCEMAHSLGLFIVDQEENPAPSFNDKVNSGSANYRSTLYSYLFMLENDENKPKDEIYSKFIRDIIISLKGEDSKGNKNYVQFREVITDFFTGIGEPWIASMLLPNKLKEKTSQRTLLTLMQVIGNMKGNSSNILKNESESKTSTTKENSKKGKEKTS
ncbi:MAG: hypothetical protein M1419_08585 [Bacteroidetes bacterium]|nr:hypothetical protein [Bacteroidota bacterium]